MASTFIDENTEQVDPNESSLNELESFESEQNQATQKQANDNANEADDSDIPEKYRGKTAKQIAQMHMEAEKLIGRQAQEVHSVRSLADSLIKQQLSTSSQTKEQEPQSSSSDIDFFENPQKAIREAVQADPAVQEARLAAQQLKAMQAQASLNQKHPDFPSIVADPEFQQWVGSSAIRKQLLQQADKDFDVTAADELFSTFKQLKATRQAAVDTTASATKKQALKAAQVDSGGAGESSKKIYRRQDILEMMQRDPDRYYSESIQNELMKAYAENRVR